MNEHDPNDEAVNFVTEHDGGELVKPDVWVPAAGPFKVPKGRARLTVVEQVCHQGVDESPAELGNSPGFSRWLESDEQPWTRRMRSDSSDWVPLECGWVVEASAMRLINVGKETINVRLSWGSSAPADVLLPPGEPARFLPADLAAVRLQCDGGFQCVVVLVPA